MPYIGIWERDEGIYEALRPRTAGLEAEFLRGRHPADFLQRPLDLLVIAPGAVGLAGSGAISCGTVLLPGAAGSQVQNLRTVSAVSYGTSPRDTLTFSSLEGEQICLALQRELVTLAGTVVEQQELVLPFPPGLSPLPFLAVTGALLLLGLAPGD